MLNLADRKKSYSLIGSIVAIFLICNCVLISCTNSTRNTSDRTVDGGTTDGSLAEVDGEEISTSTANDPQIETFHGTFEDILALYQSLNDTDEQSLPQLLKRSVNVTSLSRRSVVQQAIVGKLVELDPVSTLESIAQLPIHSRYPLVETVFSQWCLADLEAALKHAEVLDYAIRSVALKSILTTRDDLSERRRLDIADQLGDRSYGMRMNLEFNAMTTMMESPLRAWDWMAEQGMLRDSHFASVAKLVAQEVKDREGLKPIVQVLASLVEERERESKFVVDTLIESIALQNPLSFLATIRTLSPSQQEILLPQFFDIWSRAEPAVAWSAIASDHTVTRPTLASTRVIRNWARTNPHELLDVLEEFSQQHQAFAFERAIVEIAHHSIEEAAGLLTQFERQGRDTSYVERDFADIWLARNPEAAMDWILTRTNEKTGEVSADLLKDGLVHLTSVNPHRAFSLALEQPPPAWGAPMEAFVIRELAKHDVDLAVDFVGQVRDVNNGITSAYEYIGRELVKNEQPMRALRLGSKLESKEQEEFLSTVIHEWAGLDAVGLMNSLDSIESERARSIAASDLVIAQKYQPVLTEEQMSIVRSHVPDGVVFAHEMSLEEQRAFLEGAKRRAQQKREQNQDPDS